MGAILIVLALTLTGWLYEPLVYESFDAKLSIATSTTPEVISRTCVYFVGHTLVSHTIQGSYNFECPRKRGGITFQKPLPLLD